MKRQSRKLLMFGLVVLLLAGGCTLLSPAPTPVPTPIPISHVFAFGDGYTDNGNGLRLMDQTNVYWPKYWEGRLSNGPVAVEVLATRLNVQLTDYAVAGAESGTGNAGYALPNTGALSQIEKFKTELQGQTADPRALYFIMIGLEDYPWAPQVKYSGDNSALTEQTVNNIAMAISQLAQLGARRFLVVNLGDGPEVPIVTMFNQSEPVAEFQTLLNSKLPGRLDALKSQLKVEITLFDYFALSTQIRKNPSDYGLANVTDPCRPWGQSACASPDQYYFWDEMYPSRSVHQILGEAYAAIYGK